MASEINPIHPTEINPSLSTVRDNFGFAKTEIEALQVALSEVAGVGAQTATPLHIPPDTTFTVLENSQCLVAIPIRVDGYIILNGSLVNL